MRQGLESTLEHSTETEEKKFSPSNSPANSPASQHKRVASTRYDHVINGEPIAIESVRKIIEEKMKVDTEKSQKSNIDNMFEGRRVRSVTISESYALHSYFDNDGDAVESCIVLPHEDQLVHVHRKTKKSSKTSNKVKGKGWRSKTDQLNERQPLSNVVQCRRELKYISSRVSEMSRSRLLLQTDIKKYLSILNHKKYIYHLVQNMVEDVQTVANVTRKTKYAEDMKRAGGGSGSGNARRGADALTTMTNKMIKLWSKTVLSTDESLAQIYLQVKIKSSVGLKFFSLNPAATVDKY